MVRGRKLRTVRVVSPLQDKDVLAGPLLTHRRLHFFTFCSFFSFFFRFCLLTLMLSRRQKDGESVRRC